MDARDDGDRNKRNSSIGSPPNCVRDGRAAGLVSAATRRRHGCGKMSRNDRG